MTCCRRFLNYAIVCWAVLVDKGEGLLAEGDKIQKM